MSIQGVAPEPEDIPFAGVRRVLFRNQFINMVYLKGRVVWPDQWQDIWSDEFTKE